MALDKKYDPKASEPKWQRYWEEQGIFRFDPDDSSRPVYSVDTPPPTVSGSMHMGHVFSYTQAEALIRFWRQRGYNVFYPFGFDDNGLPTERFVEESRGVKGRDMPRAEFVELCLEVTREVEHKFKVLWQSLGFSCDWREEYSTIGPVSQRISQRSFLDLLARDLVYRKEEPALWCPECRTAVAQAEQEDVESETLFSDIPFALEDGGQLVIATTRPELLASCVCVFVHPDDERHAVLVGKTARTPIFDREVPILANDDVDREKGTGVVMCCTFGDTKDIEWWERFDLPLRVSIGRDGRMNELAGEYAGQKVVECRKKILRDLDARGLIVKQERIRHAVNTHERCGTPIEFIPTMQWFIKVLEHKEALIERGRSINWYPSFMRVRYEHWVDNLNWDWSISRQKFWGVPIPVWTCKACDAIVPANADQLPVDPQLVDPPHTCVCGSSDLEPESDVLDTWMTSSVTPQINGRWGESDARMEQVFPMTMRPQAHDIIRTWAFYTIVKAHHHHDTVPWRDAVISGHILDAERKKISKSKLQKGKKTALELVFGHPERVIDQFSADPIRYWACRATLGTDTAYDEEMLKQGRRFVTKIWNASRFALSHLDDYDGSAGTPTPIDRGVIARLEMMEARVTGSLESYDIGAALREIETFFWSIFCDNYLEMSKARLYEPETHGAESRRAAQATLARILSDVLRLLAPFLPHVTEEIYVNALRRDGDPVSIHTGEWPAGDGGATDESGEQALQATIDVITAVRKFKSEHNLSMGAKLSKVVIGAKDTIGELLSASLAEVTSTVRAEHVSVGIGEGDPTETSDTGIPLWIEPISS